VTLNSVAARTPDGRGLFDNLTLAFGRERTAVVGRNGVGKTTLLRLVAGLAEPAEGAIARAGTVGWLAQAQTPGDDETVAETLGVAAPLAILHRVLAGEGSLDDMAEAVRRVRDSAFGPVVLEASGGVNLSTVADIAATGVDVISVGALTHSVMQLDIGLDAG